MEITADGRLDAEEILALQSWLQRNAGSDIPAVKFLTTTLNRILEDGTITPDELDSTAKAIETILPQEHRAYAVGMRRQVAAEDRAKKRAENEARQTKQRAARDELSRNTPFYVADFMVAGTRHDHRSSVITSELQPGGIAFLKREPSNQFSHNAITVQTTNGKVIGYMPESYAEDVAPMLDAGALQLTRVKKVLEYDSGPIPVIVAKFYEPSATLPGLLRPDKRPATSGRQPQSKHSTPKSPSIKVAAVIAATLLIVIALFMLKK